MVTDLFVPSSVMMAELVTQLAGAASAPACSNPKPVVSADAHETVTCVSERSTESAGRAGRYARATLADTLLPAIANWPPAYKSLPDTASASTRSFIPEPIAVQLSPFHLAMTLAITSPTAVKSPPMQRLPAPSTTAASTGPFAPDMLGFMVLQLASLNVGPFCARISIFEKRSSTPRSAAGAQRSVGFWDTPIFFRRALH